MQLLTVLSFRTSSQLCSILRIVQDVLCFSSASRESTKEVTVRERVRSPNLESQKHGLVVREKNKWALLVPANELLLVPAKQTQTQELTNYRSD